MESSLNSSLVPLNSGGIFIGVWEKVLYATAQITLLSDTTTEIICYQSLNKQQVQTTSFNVSANQYFTYNINLNLPFVYFTVRNTSGTNQTLLNFSTLYKNISDNNKGSLQVFNDSESSGADGVSIQVNLNQNSANITCFGNVDGATTITLQLSNDDDIYYDSQYALTTTAGQDFGFSVPASSIKYCRLKSSSDVYITAFINYS